MGELMTTSTLCSPCLRGVLLTDTETAIPWLVQSAADLADLVDGRVPEGLLSPDEAARLTSLRLPKRQRDWLLGRWTAKQLAQVWYADRTGEQLPLDQFVIENDPDGAPAIRLDGARERLPASLTISHSHGHALCAILDLGLRISPAEVPNPRSTISVGADLEHVEPRELSFVLDYFTADEIAAVHAAPPAARETLITGVWSAKEAALKALRLGLAVDTRRVTCRLSPPPADEWAPFEVYLAPQMTNVSPWTLRGWWRVWGEYVLTMAVREE